MPKKGVRVGAKLRKVVEVRPDADVLECGHITRYANPRQRPSYYLPSVAEGLIKIFCNQCAETRSIV